ncbi:MAG: ABC transporter permease [Clostridia bacterium]|nr:ABC transporter permease [Clostridia bacterium]
MRRYKMSTFLGEAMKGIYRNPLSSIVSVISLVLALLVMGTFWMLKVNLDRNFESLEDYRKIVFYLKTSATDDDIEVVRKQIADAFEVDENSIEFTSKQEALEQEKETYGEEYAYIFDSYKGDANPLPDSFTVSYSESFTDTTLQQRINIITNLDSVDVAKNRRDIVDKITNLKSIVNAVSSALLVMLFFVSVFVIGNTVKLTHEARKMEIKIMRYIGATNFFIEFPFVLEGIILGIIAALSSYAVIVYSYRMVVDLFYKNYGNFIKFVNLGEAAFEVTPGMNYYVFLLAAFVVVGLLTGVLGTLSTKKHLKV